METFLHGDAVTVRLSEVHALARGLTEIKHAAKFLRRLPDEWAEVELETEHAGGVKTLSVPLALVEKTEK